MKKERYGWSAFNFSTGSMLNASQLTTFLNSLMMAALVLHVFVERERRNDVLSVLCVLIVESLEL